MAWTHIGSAAGAGSGPNPSIFRGFAATPGDLYWAFLLTDHPIDLWPAGWIQDGQYLDATNFYESWGHKQAQSVEPNTYFWTYPTGTWAAFFEAFRGGAFDPTNCRDNDGQVFTAATGTTLAAFRPTPARANDLVVYGCATGAGGTLSISAGATLLQQSGGNGTAWETPAAAGLVAARTWTRSVGTTNRFGLTTSYTALAPRSPVVHILVGSGVQVLSSPVAVEVSLSGIPATQSVVLGTPTRYWGLGNFSFGGVNGYMRAYYLEHTDELIIMPSTAITLLGYKLATGITATVTELFSI